MFVIIRGSERNNEIFVPITVFVISVYGDILTNKGQTNRLVFTLKCTVL